MKCKEETLSQKVQLPQIKVLPKITEKRLNYYTKNVTTKSFKMKIVIDEGDGTKTSITSLIEHSFTTQK